MADEISWWLHQPGDKYIPVFGDWVGGDPFEHIWSKLDNAYIGLSAAIKAGFRKQGSDDFNVVVLRKGHVVALLWMEEILDESPDVLHDLEQVVMR